jgi:hypothetical protein
MSDVDLRVVIPSRGRIEECKHATRLFPGALVVVHDYEYDDYRKALPPHVEMIAHSLEGGIAPIRQWVLDKLDNTAVLFVDDDVRYLKVVAGFETASRVIKDPVAIAQVVENAAYIAGEIGAPIFGFAQTSGDVRKYRPTDPISMAGWVGSVIGVYGRDISYDVTLRMRADIDFCFRAMLEHRIIYVDSRFSFIHHAMFQHKGGNAHIRSKERSNREMELLKSRWGQWVDFKTGKNVVRIVVKVKRRQSGFGGKG